MRVTRNYIANKRGPQREIDTLKRNLQLLNIRLFGLPADPSTGAARVEGEFGRIDRRLDDVLKAVNQR